jgi:hypothetical protein
LTIISMVFSLKAVSGCTLVLSGSDNNSRDELSGFGLFQRAIYDSENGEFLGCISYSQFWRQETDDRPFGVARAMGVVNAIFTLLTFLLATAVTFFTKSGKTTWWNMMRVFYVFALITQCCMFSVWSSNICEEFNGEDTQCVAGSDAVLGSFNCLVLFTLIIFTSIVSPPPHPVFRLYKSTHYDTDDVEESSGSDDEEYVKPRRPTCNKKSSSMIDEPKLVQCSSKASKTTTRSRRSHKSHKSTRSGGLSLLSMLSFRKDSDDWEEGDIVEIIEQFAAPHGDSNNAQKPPRSHDVVKMHTELGPEGKKTVQETLRADGSRTVKTLIDPSGNADLEALLRKELKQEAKKNKNIQEESV